LSSRYLHKVAWWIIEYDEGRQGLGLRERHTEESNRDRDRDRFLFFGGRKSCVEEKEKEVKIVVAGGKKLRYYVFFVDR
jgi:hypothetical protein